jgi:hypothetical protein
MAAETAEEAAAMAAAIDVDGAGKISAGLMYRNTAV